MDVRIDQENAQGVGALLRASRLRCGEDLRDVSKALCIRQTYLEAIESGRCQELPGPTYAIGFVRAYAEHLGLDSAEVVRRFKAETSAANGRSELVFPTPVAEAGIPGGAIVFVGAVVAVLAYGGWYLSTTKDGFFAELIAPLPERLVALLSRQDESAPMPVADSLATGAPSDPQGQRSPSSATAASLPDQPPAPSEPAEATKAGTAAGTPEPTAATSADAVTSPAVTDASPAPVRATDDPTAAPSIAAVPADQPAEASSPALVVSSPAETKEPTASPAEETAATVPDVSTQDVSRDVPAAPGGDAPQAASPPSTMPAASEFAGLPDTPLPDDPPTATGDASAAAPPRAIAEPQPTSSPAPATSTAVITDFDRPPTSARTGQDAPAEPQLASRPEEPQSTSSPTAASDESRILIRAKMNAWIQVRDDINNQMLLTRLMKPGDSYAVPNRSGLKLLTGNAGALEIQVDGEVAPSIGPVGAVRRSVALDAERLRAGTAVSE
jgi:cytoskeletal protein RodZ